MRRMFENQHAVQYGYRLLHPTKPIQNQTDFMSEKTVFISYSHDSDEHREKVLALSERLRDDGIHTLLDQYINGSPKQGCLAGC
jgi:SEFIR domain.